MKSHSLVTALIASSALTWIGCSKNASPPPTPPQPTPAEEEAPAPPPQSLSSKPEMPKPGQTLLLPQAQFIWKVQENGKKLPKPGPARLLMLSPHEGAWEANVLEDPDSRVFHKAACVQTKDGLEILTIGGTDAYLKLWKVQDGAWTSQTLWHPSFGGEWDRLRDFEIANLDDDPALEIGIATHDQGVVAVADHTATGWQINEIFRQPDTFVHEIEIGDVNGDGRNELFATPSRPNKADHSQSGGLIACMPRAGGKLKCSEIAHWNRSHAKEILVTKLGKDGPARLFVAIEASRGKPGTRHPVEIREIRLTGKNRWKDHLIASLPGGVQTRVLLPADLTGSGKTEIITTTMKAGIWRVIPPDRPGARWTARQIDPDSTGFEHAAGVADLDGDGTPELYVAADDQDEVRRYEWDGQQFVKDTIHRMDSSDLTWNVTLCDPLPLGVEPPPTR